MRTLFDEFVLQSVSGSDHGSLRRIAKFRADTWRSTLAADGHTFHSSEIGDAWDEEAMHWVVLKSPPNDSEPRIVASARLIVANSLQEIPESEQYIGRGLPNLEGPIAAPDRVVVAPVYQGRGLAARLLEVQETTAQSLHAKWAVRQASPSMVRRLATRDWSLVGPADADAKFPGVVFTIAYKILIADLVQQCRSKGAA